MSGESGPEVVMFLCLPADTPHNRGHAKELGLEWQFLGPSVPSQLSSCRMCGGEIWMSNAVRKEYATMVMSGVKGMPVCAVCLVAMEMEMGIDGEEE